MSRLHNNIDSTSTTLKGHKALNQIKIIPVCSHGPCFICVITTRTRKSDDIWSHPPKSHEDPIPSIQYLVSNYTLLCPSLKKTSHSAVNKSFYSGKPSSGTLSWSQQKNSVYFTLCFNLCLTQKTQVHLLSCFTNYPATNLCLWFMCPPPHRAGAKNNEFAN